MSRVKRGVTSHAKHKKVLRAAKGFFGRRKNTIRAAKAAAAAGLLGLLMFIVGLLVMNTLMCASAAGLFSRLPWRGRMRCGR